ncbi:DUF6778 family protein [Aquicoccus sp.]|uniref:DUF6778 family protein n=1 Tax=Aquicoccus sp. TaxID=2055851 RepID=UPI0035661334
MKRVRMAAMIVLGMAVSGCTAVDTVSRSTPFQGPTAAATAPAMQVDAFQVRVPRSLKASEANLFYPPGDIVWRGEPLGDRHAQVQKIFEQSLEMGTQGAKGAVPVMLDIEVNRFHALSEKTRYTVGGRHEIRFVVNFLDPETKEPVAKPREIDATFKGYGGTRAVEAERNGMTQKVRITNHLAGVFQKELGVKGDLQEDPAENRSAGVSHDAASPLQTGARTNSLF